MSIYHYEQYTLMMYDTGRTNRDGKAEVSYELSDKDGPIFDGTDFYPSPMISDTEGEESAGALLSFLTLCVGDTDAEYFENYTPRQIKFRDTEAEALQDWSRQLEGETE